MDRRLKREEIIHILNDIYYEMYFRYLDRDLEEWEWETFKRAKQTIKDIVEEQKH